MCRRFTLLLLVAMISGNLGIDRSALAQGKRLEPAEKPAPAPRQLQRGVVQVSNRQIDRWIFASDGDTDSARMLSESRLKSRIGHIAHLCGLNQQQRKKLEVAGRGDLKRFFDRVAEKRNQLHNGEERNGDELMQVIGEVQILGRDYRSTLFDDQSMFGKVLAMTLNPGQTDHYRRHGEDTRLSRYQSRVEWVVLTLQKDLSLSEGQRVRLLAVLLEETRPPQRFGPSDYYGIIYQASRLPEARLRPIFAEAEWRALHREFDDAKRQERVLKDFGYLPDEDDRPAGEVLSKAASQQSGDH